jgi:hypothetical protein
LVFVLFLLLQDSLDGYKETEFWYVDRGIVLAERDSRRGGSPKLYLQRQEEKWWLPTPKVPVNGLSEEARRKLQHQRESMNQILKAAMAINGQVLSEMEVPQVYLDSLPKVGWLAIFPLLFKLTPLLELNFGILSAACVLSLCGARVNQQPPVHHDGWMVGGQETIFHWVLVPLLPQYDHSSVSVLDTYLLTTHQALPM